MAKTSGRGVELSRNRSVAARMSRSRRGWPGRWQSPRCWPSRRSGAGSIQARSRTGLPLPPGTRRPARVESEYVRCGTLACLAAYDVHRARVMGRCEPTTGIKPFTALVDQVMTAEPYASAKRSWSWLPGSVRVMMWAPVDSRHGSLVVPRLGKVRMIAPSVL